jgi:segregation and condensation protein A
MEYIDNAQRMDPDIASEFIVMASELMLIKSKMLLPHEEGTENDPRREIADALMLYQQAKLVAKELRPRYDEYSGRFVKGTDDVPPEKGLPLNLDANMLVKALDSVLKRIKVAEAQRKPSELVNPLIKHKVVSVEEKITEMCDLLEEQGEASLFFLLKDSESRAELVARFMGVLELIKLRRILITTITVVDDVVEYNERGLEMMFTLNPDYIPTEVAESEFDLTPDSETNEKDDEK